MKRSSSLSSWSRNVVERRCREEVEREEGTNTVGA